MVLLPLYAMAGLDRTHDTLSCLPYPPLCCRPTAIATSGRGGTAGRRSRPTTCSRRCAFAVFVSLLSPPFFFFFGQSSGVPPWPRVLAQVHSQFFLFFWPAGRPAVGRARPRARAGAFAVDTSLYSTTWFPFPCPCSRRVQLHTPIPKPKRVQPSPVQSITFHSIPFHSVDHVVVVLA